MVINSKHGALSSGASLFVLNKIFLPKEVSTFLSKYITLLRTRNYVGNGIFSVIFKMVVFNPNDRYKIYMGCKIFGVIY